MRRLLQGPTSLAGEGMLERARTVSFALLGLTAAVGLALTAFIAQQGWPGLLTGPIPGLPVTHSAVHDATVVARPAGPPAIHGGAALGRRSADTGGAASAPRRRSGSPGTGSAVGPATKPSVVGGGGSPGRGDHVTQPASQPPGATAAPVPAPAPVAASPSPPVRAAATETAHDKGKSSFSPGHIRAKSDGSGTIAAPSATSRAKGHPHESHASSAAPGPPVPVESGGTEGAGQGARPPTPPGHAYGHYGK